MIEANDLSFVRIAPDQDFGRSPYVFTDDHAAAREMTGPPGRAGEQDQGSGHGLDLWLRLRERRQFAGRL